MEFLAEHLAFLSSPAGWAALVTLVAMEIVLGIDNLIFISILTNKLPPALQSKARRIGIGAALVLRLALLFTISIIVQLKEPVFEAFGHGFSWRDVILIAGGLFLVWKATKEIHHTVDPDDGKASVGGKVAELTMGVAIAQILVLDLVFSVDSIVTAIGMAEHVEVMILAVIIAMGVMYLASGAIAGFIERHPTTKMLALAFLLMIGIALVADGLGFHIPRGYIYTAMAFSAFVEILNVSAKRNRKV